MKKIPVVHENHLEVYNISGDFTRTVTKFGNRAKIDCPKEYLDKKSNSGSIMNFLGRYILSLHTLEKFTNDALHLTPHSNTLSGFHYNKELLKAAFLNTYLENVGNKAVPCIWQLKDRVLKT